MRIQLAALCALLAIGTAGCATATTPPPPAGTPAATSAAPAVAPAAHGIEAPRDTIPWEQVGPGWLLATWSPYQGHSPGVEVPNQPDVETVVTTLFLVDPQGGRYPITTFGPGPGTDYQVVDWSGDKTRALLTTYGMTGSYLEVDLRTGAQTPLTFRDPHASPRYTPPDGTAFLLSTNRFQEPKTLVRTDLVGTVQHTYPVGPDFGGALYTPDGTRLVVGNDTGLALLGNDGTPGPTLPVALEQGCGPMRWWSHDTVLASCGDRPSRLWTVPLDGSAPTALTAPNDGQGSNLGDVNAWRLPAGTFVQDLGACGVIYLAKLNADGTTTKVDVPDLKAGSIEVIGVNGDALRLRGDAACGGGIALVDWNPSTNTTTFLLGGPLNGGGVSSAVAFKGQR